MRKTFLNLLGMFLLLNTFVFVDAQIPYVYSVENTGSSYALPPLPVKANCQYVYFLPDPFKFADGTRSTAFSDWEHHRNDFRAMFENYEIGTRPVVDPATQVTASYSGSTLTINITANGQSMTMTCAVSIPSGATAPYPVCIGMNSSYGSVTSSLFTSRGIVGITFSHDQVTTYNSPSNSNPFFRLYPTQNIDNTGQYAAWSWGVSRIIDALYKVKAAGSFNVDINHICVTGCSYAGKMALFSGAFDERVALTIAQESGGGGATTWRYSKTQADGTVEGLAQTSDQWFKNSVKTDFGGDNVWYLPDDHHMLMAMCAPRGLIVTGNTDYTWLSNLSFYACGMAVNKIYSDLGIADRFGFVVDGGHSHCALPSSQNAPIGYFLDKFMKGQTSLSQVITTHPSAMDTLNYTRWYSQWGGGTNVPVTGVSVSPTTASISVGGTQQLTATVSPANATNKSVSWSSNNTSVATVSSSGLVTGVAVGSATITVTTVDGAKTATCNVTVTTSTGNVGILGSWVTGTSHTKESGSNRALILIAGGESTTSMNLSAVTYGGQTMIKVVEYNANYNSGYAYTVAYILKETGVAAASGSTFSVTWSGSPTSITYSSAFFSNVNQSTSTAATGTGGGTSTTVTTASLANASGDMVILGASCGNSGSYTLNNSFTEGNDQTSGSTFTMVTGRKSTTGANETPSATYSGTVNRQGIIGLVLVANGNTKSAPALDENADNNIKGIYIYPNPVSGMLNVSLNGSPSVISLYNNAGQQLLNLNTEHTNVTIDMAKYLPGIYFLKITTSDQTIMEKIIKQ